MKLRLESRDAPTCKYDEHGKMSKRKKGRKRFRIKVFCVLRMMT